MCVGGVGVYVCVCAARGCKSPEAAVASQLCVGARGRACECARVCASVCVCVCVNHPFDGSKCFGPPPPYSTLKRKKKQAPRIAKKLGNRRIRLILGVTKAFI